MRDPFMDYNGHVLTAGVVHFQYVCSKNILSFFFQSRIEQNQTSTFLFWRKNVTHCQNCAIFFYILRATSFLFWPTIYIKQTQRLWILISRVSWATRNLGQQQPQNHKSWIKKKRSEVIRRTYIENKRYLKKLFSATTFPTQSVSCQPASPIQSNSIEQIVVTLFFRFPLLWLATLKFNDIVDRVKITHKPLILNILLSGAA